jgi:hypothetical protein
MTPREYTTELSNSPVYLLSNGRPVGYPMAVADAWRVVIEKLRNEAPDAMDLLRFLAFFVEGRISIEELRQGGDLPDVSLHALLRDPIRRSRAIGHLGQAGLLRVNASTRTLHMHRLTQRIIRDTIPSREAEQWQHDVQLVLAARYPEL